MSIKIFADGADVRVIAAQANDHRVAGFTTNPSLMRAAGIGRYRAGATSVLHAARGKPVSVEVLSDDLENMEREARGIAALANNAVVKVPIVTSTGKLTTALIARLAADGIPLNITAVFTVDQAEEAAGALGGSTGRLPKMQTRPTPRNSAGTSASGPAIISVFAGRIADAGVDPLEHVTKCRKAVREICPRAEMLWASSRQAHDTRLAERAGCEIITLTADLIGKLALQGKDLDEYARETSAQFHRDAVASQYVL